MAVGNVLSTAREGFSFAFQMAWEVWWALILGFLLSGIVQAWFTRAQMERVLGGRGLKATLKATGLGAASSSCSYAAIAIAKSVFQKGAGLPAAVAFMFASTNLVFELGIVLWIFLGPAFTAAEFAGGFLLILLMWAAVHLFVSRPEEEAAREHARAADSGHQHTIAAGQRPLREQLTSLQAWSDVAHNFRGDWQMLWKEITAGFLIAGFVGQLPRSVFEAAFLQDAPAAIRTVENVLVGPLIAILSFVCSVGNIPLAAILWASGISFAGVIAFIYADLITVPILLAYRKYYGTRFALKLAGMMLGAIVLAALAVDLSSRPSGSCPKRGHRSNPSPSAASSSTTPRCSTSSSRSSAPRSSGSPCGVATPTPSAGCASTAARRHTALGWQQQTLYFCSADCRERFEANPNHYATTRKARTRARRA